MAKTLQEIFDQGRAVLVQIKANADLDRSIYDALKDRDDKLVAAAEQLKAAGTDPAKLAELAALMDELADAANAERDATVSAIKAATPARGLGAPAVEPPPVNPAAAQAEPPASPEPPAPSPPPPNPAPPAEPAAPAAQPVAEPPPA